MHFEIYREGGGGLLALGSPELWRWRLKAGNGEIIAQGEAYTSKQSCLHAVNLLRETDSCTPVAEV